MSKDPVLVLQMQRMGDLALSFPLLAKLGEAYPGHPVWVIGEPAFFKPLLPLSPNATYFSYANAPDTARQRFESVINLSFRPEAARLAGKVKTRCLVGPWMNEAGQLFIEGDWQLYRASLTHNNRYNLFHWADLNCLDALPPALALKEHALTPRPLAKDGQRGRIGLFLGASEKEKHPEAPFWAGLAGLLLKSGYKPALLGGEAEKTLGAETARLLGAPHLNLCGRFSVAALARFLAELDLFITPDTGPMHIASGLGTPVLNLSMGPVNPWETGPSAPGHHVLRAGLDCTGCWRCTRQSLRCRDSFSHGKVAAVISLLLGPEDDASIHRTRRRIPGLELMRTARDARGLYRLDSLCGNRAEHTAESMARPLLSRFWQHWFGAAFGLFPEDAPQMPWRELREDHPLAAKETARAAKAFALSLARSLRGGSAGILARSDYWQESSPLIRPLTGYVQMYAQNASGARPALMRCIALAERLAALS